MERPQRVLIGIIGGIAAYKIPLLVRLLVRSGAQVNVAITPNAVEFVGIGALATLCKHPVYKDGDFDWDMDHISLAQWADIFVICPATANTIAKISAGIADNLISTLALTFGTKTMIVPAMNTAMWENPATQDNLQRIRSRGICVLPVDSGELACGTSGAGRMIPVQQIADAIVATHALNVIRPFVGKKILIASGPTQEAIDPVRMITNRSSGKMGAAIARAALRMGASVTVVSGPATAPLPSGARVIDVTTADQMNVALTTEFKDADICIMAAAISDYKPKIASEKKLEKSGEKTLCIELVANPDIAAGLGAIKEKRFLVCFSLQTDDDQTKALQKLKRKNADMIVFNKADESIGHSESSLTILYNDDTPPTICLRQSKDDLATAILTAVAKKTESHS